MKEIEFTAHYGNQQKTVKLTLPSGTAEGGWHIYIDNRYQGVIVRLNGDWVGHLNYNSGITGDEIGILGDVIDGWE